MAARLVVSLSGLPSGAPDGPDVATVLERAAALAADLDDRGVPLSHLFRPRGEAGPARRGTPVVDWLHDRCAAGDVIVLHGYDHTSDPIGSWEAVPRLARRAEFATLPRHEAALRLVAARRAATAAGLGSDLFVPPRWLASAGTLDALREQGFAACADEAAVRLLTGPGAGTVLRSRLLGLRTVPVPGPRALRAVDRPVADDRRAAEAWRCRALLAEVTRTARRGGLVRIAVRAKDLRRAARRAAVLAAVDLALAAGAVPVTYRPQETARAA